MFPHADVEPVECGISASICEFRAADLHGRPLHVGLPAHPLLSSIHPVTSPLVDIANLTSA